MTGFEQQVVVITGAGTGIGRAVAQRFARKKAVVIVADAEKEQAVRTADSITDFGGDATPFAVDVADAAAMESFAEDVQAEFGTPAYWSTMPDMPRPDRFSNTPSRTGIG